MGCFENRSYSGEKASATSAVTNCSSDLRGHRPVIKRDLGPHSIYLTFTFFCGILCIDYFAH